MLCVRSGIVDQGHQYFSQPGDLAVPWLRPSGARSSEAWRKVGMATTEVRDPSIRGTERGVNAAVVAWLNRPLTAIWCALGWVSATGLYLGISSKLGGPSEEDVAEWAYSTWAIAHGKLACAYSPASTTFHFADITRPGPFIAPLWPLLSGGFSALFRIGHSVPFPSGTALGPNCSSALVATYKWSTQSGSALPTVRLGYLSWIVLVIGVVTLLRTSSKGRTRWEPAVLIAMACIPCACLPVTYYCHPQDVVALGLALCGVACVRKGWWARAGVLIFMAIATQQFAVLVLVPLLFLAPRERRARFIGAFAAGAAVLIVPLAVVTSGRALKPMLLGSASSPGQGGTLLWELHLPWPILSALSRALPILVAGGLSWWAVKRLGPRVFEPIPLFSLIGTSLCLRLVFEANLYGYYFMALGVSLMVLEVLRGRLRWQLLAWFAVLLLAFDPVPFGFSSNAVDWGVAARQYFPPICMGVGLLFVVVDALQGHIRRWLVAWLGVIVLAFGQFPPGSLPFRQSFPIWFWQVVLVTTGIYLVARPLVSRMRSASVVEITQRHVPEPPEKISATSSSQS
jgi:hypothetical protein